QFQRNGRGAMRDGDVRKLSRLHTDVRTDHGVGIAIIRHDVVSALRNNYDITSHHVLGDRPPVARFELATLVDVKRNLPGGDANVPNLAFNLQAAGRQVELFVHVRPAQLDRLHRGRQSKTDVDNIRSGGKDERRRR